MKKLHFSFIVAGLMLLLSHAHAQTTTYSSVGTYTFTVPTGCTSVMIDAAGGQGGNAYSTSSPGGKGGRAQGALAVTPGQQLFVYVGGAGTTSTSTSGTRAGGANGSGGGAQGGDGRGYGGGGGGSSDVRVGGTALSNRVIVAAGGGGAGYDCAMTDEWGGAGGGLTGLAGRECGTTGSCYTGLGGTQTSGGSGSTCSGTPSGSLGFGGGGSSINYSGGGGGGYYGGGSGAYGGGGGGSSYIGGTGLSGTSTTADFRTGNGYVSITPLVPTILAAPSSLAFGGVTVGETSSAISFTLTGLYLSTTGTIDVTAPTGFEVSLEGTLWFSTLSFPYTGGSLSTQTVFVRFTPTALGASSGNIVLSGGGAASVNVPVSGTGANACTGAPTPGTASVSPSSGTIATPFTLSLSGTSAVGGLSYQWQSATSTSGPWSDVTGATAPSYAYTGLSATTYFRCVVTCAAGGSATTNSVTATFTAPTYCTPAYSSASASCSSYSMFSRITSLTGSSGSIADATGCNGTGYLNNTAMSCTVLSGSSYTATIGTGYSCCMNSQIYIDLNGDGNFTSGEVVGGATAQYASPGTSYSIAIPAGTPPGSYRMRLVGNYAGCCGGLMYPNIPGCPTTAITYGETRDYTINITAPCTNPAPITGTNFVCFPGTTTLACATGGGTWSSSNTSLATVSSSGVVTGLAAGAATITYTVPGGCRSTRVVGIYGKPTVGAITPSAAGLCANTPLTLTAGATSGSVVSYSWSGPSAYTATSTANNTTFSPPGVASSGTYSVRVTSAAGCVSNPATSPVITVSVSPSVFSGPNAVCQASNISLGNTEPGGTWTSGATTLATVGASSGVVTGVGAGLVDITYTLSNLCYRSQVLSVNPLPVVTVTPPGPTTICMGESASFTANSPNPTFALLSQDFNTGLGPWTISGAGAPTGWQIVPPSANAAGVPGDGSSNMLQAAALGTITSSTITSPSFSTLGYGSAVLTFNEYLLFADPDVSARIEYSVNGGAWTLLEEHGMSPFSSVGSGAWSASTPETSISLPAPAIGQSDVRLRWKYDASQYYWYLDNISVTGQLPASTYAWTGTLGLSCTTCTNPTITPTSTGANNYSVTVTSNAGCTTTNPVVVNVNPLPGPVTGNLNVCVGTTFMLGNSASGGTWVASNGNVSIDMMSGAMTGIAVGTSEITYTLPTGCRMTAVATVAPLPSPISGSMEVCEGLTTGLSHVVSGGTWVSSNTAAATVNAFGVVSGLAAGMTNITYTLPSGCIITTSETVNATPGAITGTAVMCQGATNTLSSTPGGGNWISSDPSVATITGGGLVTGVNAGNSMMTYQLPTGCITTKLVTINALPSPITGTTSVCQGSQTILSSTTAGGVWTSSSPVNASVGAGTGVVTGGSTGFATVYYTLSSTGCAVSTPIIVNALPSAPTGDLEICQDEMTGLSSSPAGGTWTSNNPGGCYIDASSGVATGVSQSVVTVTYTLPVTGCKNTAAVTVNALPGLISGTQEVCVGQNTTLYNFTPGGIWSSGNTAIATVSPTGVVTGVGAGLVQIDYINATTGCSRSVIVTVNAQPSAITGTPQVCTGMTTGLGNADGGGTWSSSNSLIASVDVSTGVVTGGVAGNAFVTYMLPTGCATTQMVTVNGLPGTITGPAAVCSGSNITWGASPAGGNWSSDNSSIASVAGAGVITGGTAGNTTITYTLPTGCYRTRDIVVNATPTILPGTTQVCTGSSITLGASPAGGVWGSSSPANANVNSASGVVTGGVAGNANISYTLSTGCRSIQNIVVNPLPASITGNLNVCVGSTTMLADASLGGTWSVGSGVNASVDMMTGEVLGGNAGPETIIYTLPTTCARSVVVNVNPLPAPIFGTLNVCENSTTALTDATPGGTWSSSNTTLATITSAGLALGKNQGNATITYKLPTGCQSVASLVVNGLPADITGGTDVCVGSSMSLANSTAGGNWTSGNALIANVDGTGMVSGVAAGSVYITYTRPTGCYKTKLVQVNALPAPIAGNMNICEGSSTFLGDATPGGTWSSSDMSVAMINSLTGSAIGSSAGFSIITYMLGTGCYTTSSLIVNSVPDAITGNMTVCAGSTTQLENATPGGVWSTSNGASSIDATGLVTGVAAGTSVVTYKTGNNCRRIAVVSINPLPALIAGNGNVCQGLTSIYSNANLGGTWTTDDASVADIDGMSGIITSGNVGTANITYTLPTGCMRARMVEVHPSVEPVTGTTNVCKGLTTTLSSATMGGMWASGNSAVATVDMSTGEVTGVNAGAAVITYSVNTGCMAIANVVVNALPANITGAMSVCEGSTATLMNATSGGSWSSSDDALATVSSSGVVTGVASGSVMITYTLPTGCMKSRDMMVNGLPATQNVTGGGSYCSGGSGVAIGVDGTETGVTYSLMLSSVNMGSIAGTGSLLDFGMKTTAGVYTVKATTDAGCSAMMDGTATIAITSLVTPAVSMTSSVGDSTCAGTSVTYSAVPVNGGTAPTYTWSVAGSPVATGDTYDYTPANGDVITVAMVSNAACPSVASVSASKSMTVIAKLTPSVSIVVGPDDTLCSGSMATFAAVGVNGGNAPVYTWIVGGTIVPGVTGPTYTYMPSNNQSVICKLNSSYRCPSVNNVSSNTIMMHIDQQYIPAVNIIAQPGTVINAGETVTFTTVVNGAGPEPKYQWLIRGSIVPGATQPTFSSNDLNDGDSVTCVVWGTGRCGMETINSVVMKVNATTSVASTGVAASELRMMPNPTSGAFVVTGTIGNKASEVVNLEVTDMLGQVVYRGQTTTKGGELNASVQLTGNLANGMYMLNVSNGSERKVFHFVLKQ
ncbi:MAG: Ig-like domain-containing protein [Taibaiella sp.]|nr:Ig-like domain-containing protein [Taibaiella sp.]